MTTEERRALLDRAITTYGAPAQMDMAVEDTRVACDLCGGSGRLKGGKHGKE